MKNAKQIVGAMLEDYGFAGEFNDPERPGGSADMWRQGGYQKFDLNTMDISGRRPGEPLEAPEEAPVPDTNAPKLSDTERAKLDIANATGADAKRKKIQPGMGSPARFHWKPPTP